MTINNNNINIKIYLEELTKSLQFFKIILKNSFKDIEKSRSKII